MKTEIGIHWNYFGKYLRGNSQELRVTQRLVNQPIVLKIILKPKKGGICALQIHTDLQYGKNVFYKIEMIHLFFSLLSLSNI